MALGYIPTKSFLFSYSSFSLCERRLFLKRDCLKEAGSVEILQVFNRHYKKRFLSQIIKF